MSKMSPEFHSRNFNMTNSILFIKKLSFFLFGLYLMSIGVIFSVNANLGVSPISCVPYIYDLASP